MYLRENAGIEQLIGTKLRMAKYVNNIATKMINKKIHLSTCIQTYYILLHIHTVGFIKPYEIRFINAVMDFGKFL